MTEKGKGTIISMACIAHNDGVFGDDLCGDTMGINDGFHDNRHIDNTIINNSHKGSPA